MKNTLQNKLIFFIFILAFTSTAFSATKVVNLVVAYKMVNFTGKTVKAIAVNDQIPGPTLHFKEGDHVIINVYNHLDTGTSIHWHGILLPWRMDGVTWVTQKPIPPGGVFHYEYILKQSGTYWYHAHKGLQEQQGLYGAYLIDPPHREPYKYNVDIPIVLSDWIDTNPEKVYANLKKDGDYYSPRFPLQPSLARFISEYNQAQTAEERARVLNAYKMMQHMRMSIFDMSDVAYDVFLLNGHPISNPWIKKVKVGDVVRLRFIDAGATTIFHIKIPGEKMHIVHVQGNDVKPYDVDTFTMDPAETYDILLKVTKNAPYIIYAESNDKVGKVYGALVTDVNQQIDFDSVIPFPEPQPQTGMGHMQMSGGSMQGMSMPGMNMSATSMPGMKMSSMSGMKMGSMSSHNKNMTMGNMANMPMQHNQKMPMMNMSSGMKMPVSAGKSDDTDVRYTHLMATHPTNNPNIPVHVNQIVLSGYMDQFIWFINGVPEYKAKPIMIESGQRYRFVFINKSMMHHPMHLHGHWFILRNGHGAYDPLLHTIDVPPGQTVTVDFDANTDGQWYFHCHNLYHMRAGMANIVRYVSSYDYPPYLQGHKTQQWYFANLLDLNGDFYHHVYEATFNGLYGPDYNKLQLHTEEAEMEDGAVENADIDIFYWHLISQFWAIKGGANYFYRPGKTPYWQPGIGIEGLMPYFIQTNLRGYYHSGSAKADLILGRDTQITNNFFIGTEIRSIWATKTVSADEIGSGLNDVEFTLRPFYRLMPGLTVYAQYEHTHYYGPVRKIRSNNDEENSENTESLGFTILF